MKVISIIENTSRKGLPVEHGLSLYIQLNNGHTVLFDMGQSAMFADNAKELGLRVEDVDTAIISHGHYDHGGGLTAFLELNSKAKVYIHKMAFEGHYSQKDTGLKYIGIDPNLKVNERFVLCDDQTTVANVGILFAGVDGNVCRPFGNRLLFKDSPLGVASADPVVAGFCLKTECSAINDDFCHEQNLIIEEGNKTILFAGCAHNGIVNIINKAKEILGHYPTHVLAGMHLVKSGLDEKTENAFIANLANELLSIEGCTFYTMHCTGTDQYGKLKVIMKDRIEYLSCGDSIVV